MASAERHGPRLAASRGRAVAGRALACAALAACTPASLSPDAPSAPADRVVVSQAGSSTLLVIDVGSGGALARIDVGMLPHNVIVSPDGRTLYAALVGSQAIAEIDLATLTLRRTLLTAPVPERRTDGSIIQAHIDEDAFEASTCYGCHRPGGAQPRYAGDRPFGMLLSPDGRRLYVTHLRASRLTILDLDQGRIETTTSLAAAGTATEIVAIARVGDEIWIALRAPQPSLQPGALRRLAADTGAPIADVPTGADPGALLSLPDRGRVLVSNFETDTVTMHDAGDGGHAPTVRFQVAPGPLGLLALDASRVLAVDYYSNAVSFLDLDTGGSQTLPLEHDGLPYANPTNAALSSDGQSAWIVSSGTEGHLLQVDLQARAIVRERPIDGLSFGVAVVPGMLP